MQEIYNTYISATEKELEATKVKLKEMTPPAMHSMLDKQSRSDAIEKKAKRNRLTVEDIPPTTPGNNVIILYKFDECLGVQSLWQLKYSYHAWQE